MARVLYVSYTGMMEPLGQSQVLQYLFKLSQEHEITLVSFEKIAHLEDEKSVRGIRQLINGSSIHWVPVRYHKKPRILASAYDILIMLLTIFKLQRKHEFDLIHCRSYIPAISGLLLKKFFGVRFLFDMRGFWPDERVDGGIWKKDFCVYRVVKKLERVLLTQADHIVSLTHSGVREIKKFPYINLDSFNYSVIPTCTNLDTFQPQKKVKKTGKESFVVGMVGSVGSWYLFDEMLQCFKQIAEINDNAKLLIINRSDHDFIRMKLKQKNIPETLVEITSADYSQVASQMAKMDIGLFFIKPVFSKQASAPTKLGEFLGCGIPCVSNSGVGDMDEILEPTDTGVCIDVFDDTSYKYAYEKILGVLESEFCVERCRKTAEKIFSLEVGAEEYSNIYKALLN